MSKLAVFKRESIVKALENKIGLDKISFDNAIKFLNCARKNIDGLSLLEGDGIIAEFEKTFAQYVGARFGIAVSSGTLGLIVALLACGVRANDEVIVSPYGWGSTVGSVLAVGAIPVFVDIDPKTFNIDPQKIKFRITKKTSAILATHLFGYPCDCIELERVAREYKLSLVFDAAQAFGAMYNGKPIGAWGNAVVFSLGRGKAICTGEGGIIVTNDPDIFEQAILMSQHPIRGFREIDNPHLREYIDEISLSCRIHPIAAAIGLGQLQVVTKHLCQKREICLSLIQGLKDIPGFYVPCEKNGSVHAFHTFAMTYHKERCYDIPREILLRVLQRKGVPILKGPVQIPIHLRNRFQNHSKKPFIMPFKAHPSWQKGSCPNAEKRCISEEVFIQSKSHWLGCSKKRAKELVDAFHKVSDELPQLAVLCNKNTGILID
jgi:perosamine synthetase